MMHDEIAIMTMAYNPLLKMHAICNVLDQTYPAKVLHLLHQSPFPPPLIHDNFIRIVEHCVAGTWPQLWYYKLNTFVGKGDSPYFAVMDEDDRFEPQYLEKAIVPIQAGARFAWNHNNIVIKNDLRGAEKLPVFQYREYRSGFGTLVGRLDALRHAVTVLSHECPHGLSKTGGGPVDAILKRIIKKEGVVAHAGLRRYFYHMNTNTKGDRDARESIDYGWAERKAPGRFHGRKKR